MSKIVDYTIDFFAGADPTGLASQVRAKQITKNHTSHRAVNDLGGFALGAGISTALSGGALLAGSMLAKGSTKTVLRQAAKDTMLIFKPKEALKSLKGLNESYPILQKQEQISNELLNNPTIKNALHSNTNSASEAFEVGKKFMHSSPEELANYKRDAQKYKDSINELETNTKNFKEKYNDDPLNVSRKGAAVAGTIATGILGGSLNAMTSDIQYQSGRKFKEYENKLEDKKKMTKQASINLVTDRLLEKYAFFGLGKKEPEDPKVQAEREMQRYVIANQYVYSRAAHGGLSYGMRPPKDFDSDHYNRFIKEPNADKKYAIMVEKYPLAKEWLGEGGGDYFRQHGAGQ